MAETVTISRLKAHCSAVGDVTVARLRLAHAMETADFAPRGFPPGETLLVRRLTVSRPVALDGLLVGLAWEQETREALTRLWRRAARPVRGRIPAREHEAVVFADAAERLACIALAHLSGETAVWPWRELLNRKQLNSGTADVIRLWTQEASFLPSAFAALAEWGEAVRFLAALPPDAVSDLLNVLAAEWPEWRPALQVLSETIRTEETLQQSASDTSAQEERFASVFEEATQEGKASSDSSTALAERPGLLQALPWEPYLRGEAAAFWQLPAPARLLLGLSLTLYHSPATSHNKYRVSEISGALLERPLPPSHRAVLSEPRNEMPKQGVSVVPSTAQSHDKGEREPEATHLAPLWNDATGVFTRLGGVLYLLNFFTACRLPEVFDAEWSLSEHITGWGLVELLASALLGTNADYGDPLWNALTQLDGRSPGEPPAPDLPLPPRYRIPSAWLLYRDLPDLPWMYHAQDGRLRLFHPVGPFLIADDPRDTTLAPAEQAKQISKEYALLLVSEGQLAPNAAEMGTVSIRPMLQPVRRYTHPLSPAVRRWTSGAFPYLLWRLETALADPEPDGINTILQASGRLYVTRTHVDMVMPLSAISLLARRAGLDRNPGWVRDLMRVVTFHFE